MHFMERKSSSRQIFGEEVRGLALQNLSLVKCIYPAKATMPRHTHEIAHVSFVLQGSFTEICGRKERSSNSSTLIIHPPDEDHAVAFHDAGARVFSFHVKNRMLRKIRDFTDVLDAPAVFGSAELSWLTARLYRESQATDAVAPLMLEALAFEIIAATSRRAESLRERNVPCWLKQAQEYLHAHFAENISFSALAETVGAHPVYLAREFRRRYGCTMGDYVRRIRIETACRKIAESDLPLDEIALMTGFYDQSHFTNVFKRFTGMTPAQYRAIFRQR
jgi:AraC family transcriptional regulator